MGALQGCHAVTFDSCNNLWSSIHTILVIILQFVGLNNKEKAVITIIKLKNLLVGYVSANVTSMLSNHKRKTKRCIDHTMKTSQGRPSP